MNEILSIDAFDNPLINLNLAISQKVCRLRIADPFIMIFQVIKNDKNKQNKELHIQSVKQALQNNNKKGN